MKVGIIGHGFIGWNGGVDFIRNITMCLQSAIRPGDALVILLPWTGTVESIPPCFFQFRTDFGGDVEVALVLQSDEGFHHAITSHGIDLIMPALTVLSPGFRLPWVGYLYDFQHKFIPQFFSEQESLRRDQEFHRMLTMAKTIIVNSANVAQHANAFLPNAPAHIFAQPFSAGANKRWLALPDESAFRPVDPYLIICNQFWVHKDHLTAFRAFAAIAEEFDDLQLVCTGPVSDHRYPQYNDLIQATLHEHGIADRVRILGCIPKDDQIILLKNAVALLQPTLFEGGPGGGAVHDAVGLGVPCFVSNIAVNLELQEEQVCFFAAGDSADLAEKLRVFLRSPLPPRPSTETLEQHGLMRRKRCGALLWQAVDDRLAQA